MNVWTFVSAAHAVYLNGVVQQYFTFCHRGTIKI